MATQGSSNELGQLMASRPRKDPVDWLEVDEGHQRSGLNSVLFFIFPMIVLAAIVSALAGFVH